MEAANIVLFNSTKDSPGACYRVWFCKNELILNSKHCQPTSQPNRVIHCVCDKCLIYMTYIVEQLIFAKLVHPNWRTVCQRRLYHLFRIYFGLLFLMELVCVQCEHMICFALKCGRRAIASSELWKFIFFLGDWLEPLIVRILCSLNCGYLYFFRNAVVTFQYL